MLVRQEKGEREGGNTTSMVYRPVLQSLYHLINPSL